MHATHTHTHTHTQACACAHTHTHTHTHTSNRIRLSLSEIEKAGIQSRLKIIEKIIGFVTCIAFLMWQGSGGHDDYACMCTRTCTHACMQAGVHIHTHDVWWYCIHVELVFVFFSFPSLQFQILGSPKSVGSKTEQKRGGGGGGGELLGRKRCNSRNFTLVALISFLSF